MRLGLLWFLAGDIVIDCTIKYNWFSVIMNIENAQLFSAILIYNSDAVLNEEVKGLSFFTLQSGHLLFELGITIAQVCNGDHDAICDTVIVTLLIRRLIV